ncbi:hypothetical protein BMY_0072 [Wohlfahrtiimonas chitiniclastica]|nr:hypothetical protein BMY_0072 [Wohlfahrtiimonas chitiniclastica]
MAKAVFLSCLCGSEPLYGINGVASIFLSCLCGSELYWLL